MADGEKEKEEPALIFNIGDQVAGYKIKEKIDEGGFGQVFKVNKDDKIYAMKIESNMQEGGSAIKLEIDVLAELKMKKLENFPKFYQAGKRVKYHFLVMELLGENLKSLRYRSANPDSLSNGTWSRVGIQCLFVVKTLHDCGFLHRDIKPSNFAMGNGEDILKGRVIYLFDFGLARRFVLRKKQMETSARPTKELSINESNREKNTTTVNTSVRERKGKEKKCQKSKRRTKRKDDLEGTTFQFRIARPHTDFRGTYQYASPNAHLLIELGRADDVWSLMYMIAEMCYPLPWAINTDAPIEELKSQTTLDMLFRNEAFRKIEENLRSCNYYSSPDYEMCYQVMKEILDKSGTKWNDPYDWETNELPSYAKWKEEKAKMTSLYPWEEPKDFFKKDVWAGIPTPTLKKAGEEKTRSKYMKVQLKSEMKNNAAAADEQDTKDSKDTRDSKENPSKEREKDGGGKDEPQPQPTQRKEESQRKRKPSADGLETSREKPTATAPTIMQSVMAMNAELKSKEKEQKGAAAGVHVEKSNTNNTKDGGGAAAAGPVSTRTREQSVIQGPEGGGGAQGAAAADKGGATETATPQNASVYKVSSCARGASVMGPAQGGMTLRKNPSMMGTIEDENTGGVPAARPKGSKGTGKNKKDGALNKMKKLMGMKPSCT